MSAACTCPPVEQLLAWRLTNDGPAEHSCAVHTPTQEAAVPAVALNDDTALAAIIGAALTKTEGA